MGAVKWCRNWFCQTDLWFVCQDLHSQEAPGAFRRGGFSELDEPAEGAELQWPQPQPVSSQPKWGPPGTSPCLHPGQLSATHPRRRRRGPPCQRHAQDHLTHSWPLWWHRQLQVCVKSGPYIYILEGGGEYFKLLFLFITSCLRCSTGFNLFQLLVLSDWHYSWSFCAQMKIFIKNFTTKC